jgi:hypothetical protein
MDYNLNTPDPATMLYLKIVPEYLAEGMPAHPDLP